MLKQEYLTRLCTLKTFEYKFCTLLKKQQIRTLYQINTDWTFLDYKYGNCTNILLLCTPEGTVLL